MQARSRFGAPRNRPAVRYRITIRHCRCATRRRGGDDKVRGRKPLRGGARVMSRMIGCLVDQHPGWVVPLAALCAGSPATRRCACSTSPGTAPARRGPPGSPPPASRPGPGSGARTSSGCWATIPASRSGTGLTDSLLSLAAAILCVLAALAPCGTQLGPPRPWRRASCSGLAWLRCTRSAWRACRFPVCSSGIGRWPARRWRAAARSRQRPFLVHTPAAGEHGRTDPGRCGDAHDRRGRDPALHRDGGRRDRAGSRGRAAWPEPAALVLAGAVAGLMLTVLAFAALALFAERMRRANVALRASEAAHRLSEERLALAVDGDGLWDRRPRRWPDVAVGPLAVDAGLRARRAGEPQPDLGAARPPRRRGPGPAPAERASGGARGPLRERASHAAAGRRLDLGVVRGKVVARDPSGRPARMVGLQADTTMRRAAERRIAHMALTTR